MTRSGLKIGYLVQQFPPEIGAGPARVTELGRRWQAHGARLTVITGMPNRPEGIIQKPYRGKFFVEEEWRGIRVLRSWLYASPKHGFSRTVLNNVTFMATSALLALARAEGLDVLIASSPPFFPHITGAFFCGLRRVPLILEVRDLWPDYLVGMGVLKEGVATHALFALERALLRRAENVVVVTESFRKRVIEKGVTPERVTVVPNGVDTRFYVPLDMAAPLPSVCRQNGEFIVGYLGNFGAGQGLATIVDAAAMLSRNAEGRFRFVLVGDGPDRARVEARVRELDARNVIVHGAIPKEQTRSFYNGCDVCLVPLARYAILQETVPSKIFEVMACSRPLVASLAGEAAQIVNESGGGLVVPPGDAAALATSIDRLRAMSSRERADMGVRGRTYVAQHYDRDVLADHYYATLERVARARAGAGGSR
jgi:glycosyltransferase involved in cell wall biosynthesis